MPKFRRLVVPGYPHHVTQRGVRRQATFFDDLDYKTYLRLAANFLVPSSLEIWAYCLMPNHFHLLVRSTAGVAWESMRRFQNGYVRLFNRSHRRDGGGARRPRTADPGRSAPG